MNANLLNCTLSEYHARPEWSRSQVWTAVSQGWPLFHGTFVSKRFPPKESRAFDIGTAAHDLLAGGGNVVRVIPEKRLAKNRARSGASYQRWVETHPGKIDLKREEWASVKTMANNVRRHPQLARMMDRAIGREVAIAWTDEETGLELRAYIDLLTGWDTGTIVVDYKTTRCETPREFSRSVLDYGYHFQAAWYTEAVRQLGYDVIAFLVVTVDKSPAHECRVYQLSQRAIDLGHRKMRETLAELAYRVNADYWDSPGSDEVLEIDLPEWAYRED
jgi:hypothetical protein